MNEFTLPAHHELELKTILALDYGSKFIGLASFCVNRDPYPLPYGRIVNTSPEKIISELERIISDETVDLLVVGLPFLTDGKSTAMTLRAETFMNGLRAKLSVPVETQDETLSTFEAESRMKQSPRYNFQVDYSQIDALAASVILEDFIRRMKRESGL